MIYGFIVDKSIIILFMNIIISLGGLYERFKHDSFQNRNSLIKILKKEMIFI